MQGVPETFFRYFFDLATGPPALYIEPSANPADLAKGYTPRSSKMTTWFELSRDLKKGDRVIFTTSLDRYSEDLIVPPGTVCTVTENDLNEMEPTLYLLPDDTAIRDKLALWEGQIMLTLADSENYDWQEIAPVTLLQE
jgi:hypothetical protein